MSERPTRRSLGHLLTQIEEEQKKNVSEYSGGHLNERNLYHPPREWNDHKWETSKFTSGALLPLAKPLEKKIVLDRNSEAREALKNFSLGTTGIITKSGPTEPVRRGTKLPVTIERAASVSSQGSYSRLDDGVLVENMDASQTIVKNMSPNKPVLWTDNDNDSHNQVSVGNLKHGNLENLKHRFVSSYLNSVTRKDQFRKMKEFEETVLSKRNVLEKNILSGVKAVEHLELKLQQELQDLQYHGYGPNFHRLQVYSNTFEDLIDESPTFRYILGTIKQQEVFRETGTVIKELQACVEIPDEQYWVCDISLEFYTTDIYILASVEKKEYDDYISSLLDQQPSRHRLLYEQVEQLSSHGTSNPHVLRDEQARLMQLQASARSLLLENSSYRRQLELEQQLSQTVTDQEEESTRVNTVNVEPDLELADRIEETHATILEKIDQLKELRKTLRQEFVPSTVVTHLEQCIKETEVESQRYQSQKEYFERSCYEMEKELKETIESADTTEKDSKRIWKKVNSSRRDYGSDSEECEDEDKWGWYIS